MRQAAPEVATRRADGRPVRPGARAQMTRPARRPSSQDCPVETLVRLAVDAEAEGDLQLAIRIWRQLLGYSHPRPRPVEVEPEARIELEAALGQARRGGPGDTRAGAGHERGGRKMIPQSAEPKDRNEQGSGRPTRPRASGTGEVARKLQAMGFCPMEALTRLAARAEQDGAPRLAFAAMQDVLRTLHPRPRAIEIDPEARVDLERRIAGRKLAAEEPEERYPDHMYMIGKFFGLTDEELLNPSGGLDLASRL